VVAIGCDDSASTAISPVQTIDIVSNSKHISLQKENQLLIYPNPSKTHIHIEFPFNLECTSIEIVNITGKSLIVATLNKTDKATINTSELNAGLYFVKATFDNGKILTNKIFITK
jgi:hypothetical protein